MSANNDTFNSFDVATTSQRPTTGYRGATATSRPSTSHYNRGGTAVGGRAGGHQSQHLMTDTVSSTSTQNRIGTALGYAGNLMAAERPLTQHGLSGLPSTAVAGGAATSTAAGGRLGTATAGGMRQIKDKRYWQAQLQLKMAEIQRETERLARERDTMQRERSAKRSFEKRVQEAAKELTALQATLTDMNIVLDAHTSGLTRQQLQHQTAGLRDHNERTQSQLEHQFHQRQARTAEQTDMQAAVAAERQRLDDMVFALPADDQQQYRQLQASSEQLHQQLAAAQERDAAAAAHLARLQATVGQSTARSEAVRLLGRLAELQQRSQQMLAEQAQRPSPAQEREQLIVEVRADQQTLVGVNNQLRLVDGQLQQKRELLAQIEQDLEEGQSDRHAKYKELRRRDETMSAFMDTFAESMEREKRAVDQLKNQITYGIEQITMQGINLKQFGIQPDGGEKNDLGSQDGLAREYKRLSVQLQQLQLLERRTGAQLAELRQQEEQSRTDAQRFGNVSSLRDEAAERMSELTTTIEQLQKKKATTVGVVEESRRRNDELKTKLTGHERYRQIAHLEDRLAELMRNNTAAEQALAQHRREHDYTELQKKVEQQLVAVMKQLAAATNNGN